MSVVATLEGNFVEISQCKNPEYFFAVFNFPEEVHGKFFKVEEMPMPPKTRILCLTKTQASLFELKPGTHYKMLTSLSVSRANETDGKSYPASLNISILKIL